MRHYTVGQEPQTWNIVCKFMGDDAKFMTSSLCRVVPRKTAGKTAAQQNFARGLGTLSTITFVIFAFFGSARGMIVERFLRVEMEEEEGGKQQ